MNIERRLHDVTKVRRTRSVCRDHIEESRLFPTQSMDDQTNPEL